MANLFWKRKAETTLNLLSVPFATEEEFERAVFETKDLLEEVYLLKRQVRGGKKPGIPDIIGVEKGDLLFARIHRCTPGERVASGSSISRMWVRSSRFSRPARREEEAMPRASPTTSNEARRERRPAQPMESRLKPH